MKRPWKEWFTAQVDSDYKDDSAFGVNCFIDDAEAKKYFKRLEKLSAKVLIDDYDNEAIFVKLPKNKAAREKVFLAIITSSPSPTDTHYSKKTDTLELAWS